MSARGYPSKLTNIEFCKAVAEAYITGIGRKDMAEMFDCAESTISTWVKDPRVQAHAARFAQERVNRITRRVDAEIEGRLTQVEKMDIDHLLRIRKEYLERALKVDLTAGQTHSETVNEAVTALENDPDLADALQALVQGRSK